MTGRDRKVLAVVGTPVLAVLALGIVVVAADHPVMQRRAPAEGRTRAAVAIRDHVIPFQKWGTRLFTVPLLEEGYDRVYYMTQAHRGDRRAELAAALTDALTKHDEVDLFLLAHGNRFVDWVEEVDPALRQRLRLVYNTGCAGGWQAPEWLRTGADVYVGHNADQSLSPAFYFYFLRRWVRGWSLDEAVRAGNQAAAQRLDWFGVGDERLDATATISGSSSLWLGGSR